MIPFIQRLVHQSWTELQHNRGLDIDWDLLVKLDTLNFIRVYTLGDVGVAVALLSPSIHERGKRVAVIETIYMERSYRVHSQDFLEYIENELRAEGVHSLTIGLPPKYGDKPRLLEGKPYKKTDNLFMRTL